MTEPVLLYLHGFHSSPQSVKGQMMATFIQTHYPHIKLIIPQLPVTPKQAAKVVCELVEQHAHAQIGIVGSSMGGYLASFAVERYDNCRAVVVNPAIKPYELLQDFFGPQTQPYTGENYTIGPEHIEELITIDTPVLTKPEKFWLLQQEGDEVLDYREALNKYQGCRITCEPDGDHSFVGFDRYLKGIVNFLELA